MRPDFVRGPRTWRWQSRKGSQKVAGLAAEVTQDVQVVDGEPHQPLELGSVHVVALARGKNTGFLQPKADGAHVLRSCANVQAVVAEALGKHLEVHLFGSVLHV